MERKLLKLFLKFLEENSTLQVIYVPETVKYHI